MHHYASIFALFSCILTLFRRSTVWVLLFVSITVSHPLSFQDLGSAHGTFLGGIRLKPHEPLGISLVLAPHSGWCWERGVIQSFCKYLNSQIKTLIPGVAINEETCLLDFWSWRHLTCQELRAKREKTSCTKLTHFKILKVKGSLERWAKRWPNDGHFLSFWVLTDTPKESAEMYT